MHRTRIRGRARLGDQPLLFESGNDPAQIAGVQAQLAAQVRAGQLLTMRQFKQDAHLRQRKRAVQQVFMQYANLACIETVETTHDLRALTELTRLHVTPPIYLLIADY